MIFNRFQKKKRKNTFLEWWKNATFLCEIDPHFNTPSTGCAWDIIVWLESIVLRVMQTLISCSGRCRRVTILFPKWQSREEFSGINLQNASFCESSIDFFLLPNIMKCSSYQSSKALHLLKYFACPQISL